MSPAPALMPISDDLSFSTVVPSIRGNTLFTTMCRHGIDAQMIARLHSIAVQSAGYTTLSALHQPDSTGR